MEEKKVKSALFSILSIVFLDLLGVGIAIPVVASLFLSTDGILPGVSFARRAILLGFLIASYPLAQFFGAPLLGGLSDRVGRKKILFLALVGTFIGYVIFAIGIIEQSIALLFISRIVDGFTGGNISIALSAIADISDEKSKARNFGLMGMTFGLGFILGPYIGGKLSDPSLLSWFNYSTPFWFAAILTVVNMILMLRLFPETTTVRIHKKLSLFTGFENITKAFKFTNLRTLFIVVFLLALGFPGFFFWIGALAVYGKRYWKSFAHGWGARIGFAFLVGFCVRNLTDDVWISSNAESFWFLIGVFLPIREENKR